MGSFLVLEEPLKENKGPRFRGPHAQVDSPANLSGAPVDLLIIRINWRGRIPALGFGIRHIA